MSDVSKIWRAQPHGGFDPPHPVAKTVHPTSPIRPVPYSRQLA